jgi:ABC-type hemin transport system ATPase subunit
MPDSMGRKHACVGENTVGTVTVLVTMRGSIDRMNVHGKKTLLAGTPKMALQRAREHVDANIFLPFCAYKVLKMCAFARVAMAMPRTVDTTCIWEDKIRSDELWINLKEQHKNLGTLFPSYGC